MPTTTNGSDDISCSLGFGDTGVPVSRLQIGLNSKCNLKAGLAVDGIYGSHTEAAVLKLQEHFGIEASGVYGPQTGFTMQWPVAGSDSRSCASVI